MKEIYSKLADYGFIELSHSYQRAVTPDKVISLIPSEGYLYPEIIQLPELASGEMQAVSLNRIDTVKELKDLWKVVSGEELSQVAVPKKLVLTVTKEWFDLLLSGEKKEEYRALKDYWLTRLWEKQSPLYHTPKKYSSVEFRNGYSTTARTVEFEFLKVHVGKGKQEWGAVSGEEYNVITLGQELSRKNIEA